MAHRNPCLNAARSLHVVLYLAICLAWQATSLADYTSVTSIELQALDPITGELVSAGGEASTSWPVGVTLRLKATLSEDRPERFIEFVGERGEAPNVTAVWNGSVATTSYAPKLANAYATINTTGLTNFTAIDPSEISEHAGTISNVVKITMVGVDRIIVAEVTDEDEGPIWVAKGLPITLRAIPMPADAPFPAGFPKWTLTRVGGSSSTYEGTPVARVVPAVEADYTVLAACGITSKTMDLKAIVAFIQRDEAGGEVAWPPISNQNRKVMVGQKMILRAWAPLPSGVTVASRKWTLGGVNFKDWTANQTNGVLTPMSAADLATYIVSFYWTDPDTQRGVTAAMTLSNGANLYVRDEFNVQSPPVMFTRRVGVVRLVEEPSWADSYTPESSRGSIGLVAKPGGSPAGIVFDATLFITDSFASGEWNFVQLVKTARWSVLDDADSTQVPFPPNGQWFLDGLYPYPGVFDESPPHGEEILRASDSPATRFKDSETDSTRPPQKRVFVENEEFVTTLMYKPPGVNSQYVPIQSIRWSWSGSVSKNPISGEWTMDAGTAPPTINPPMYTTEHPVWTNNWVDYLADYLENSQD